MVEQQDLRLNSPFQELLDYTNSFNLSELPLEDHSHVPFVVLLLQAINNWKTDHEGKIPANFKEKGEFKEKYLKSLAMDFGKEVNFEEAMKKAYLLFQETTIEDTLQEIFDSPHIDDNAVQDKFWVLCAALKRFYGEH